MFRYIYNELVISNNVKDVLKVTSNKDICIDFNNILPVPKSIDRKNFISKYMRHKYNQNILLKWRNNNWGIKQNVIAANIEGNKIHFITAYDGAPNVIKVLSTKFPDIEFNYTYRKLDLEDDKCIHHFIFINGQNINL